MLAITNPLNGQFPKGLNALTPEQEVNTKLSETKRKLEQQVDQLRQQLAEETVNVERLQVTMLC